MRSFRNRNRGASLFAILAIVIVIAVAGFAVYRYLLPLWWPKRTESNLVRGYLAVAIEPSNRPNSNEFHPPTKKGKDIYLPGITVK